MKVALVHDYLNQFGGAERVLWTLHEIYPEAPVYTSLYAPKKMPDYFGQLKVISSDMQKIPLVSLFSKQYTFMYPLVFENYDLSQYDVVISSSANFAKGVLVKPHTLHICYCHTPPRFLYHYPTEVNRRKIRYLAPLLSIMDNYFRIWDYSAAQRVDYFIANSNNTAKKIEKFYRREAEVIYPPVRTRITAFGASSIPENYFLIVSRLAQFKRIDLAIEACNQLHRKLIIIGEGRDEKRLRNLAGETIEFKGNLNDVELAEYYKGCQAFLFPGEDDFGITPVEAMGMGKPVIALGKGGALETVIPGKTGEFFKEESTESLMQILADFNPSKYKADSCKKQAENFSEKIFKQKIREFVDTKWDHFQKREKEREIYARTT